MVLMYNDREQGVWGLAPRNFLCYTLKILLSQGSKFSDFSLISDFFPTPRNILEIRVNLKRNFLAGRGMGIGVN